MAVGYAINNQQLAGEGRDLGSETKPWQQLLRCKSCEPAWTRFWTTLHQHSKEGTLDQIRFTRTRACKECGCSCPTGVELTHYQSMM